MGLRSTRSSTYNETDTPGHNSWGNTGVGISTPSGSGVRAGVGSCFGQLSLIIFSSSGFSFLFALQFTLRFRHKNNICASSSSRMIGQQLISCASTSRTTGPTSGTRPPTTRKRGSLPRTRWNGARRMQWM